MSEFAVALKYASDLGTDTSAAGWVFDGNTSEATYGRVRVGIEDGDPAILDALPAPDLSSQWADGLTGPQLVNDAMTFAGLPAGPLDLTDICDAYETAYGHGMFRSGWPLRPTRRDLRGWRRAAKAHMGRIR